MIWAVQKAYFLGMKFMNKRPLVDTNLLIYAHDSKSPFFEKSYSFLKENILTDKICFSNQNFLEAYRIWTQKLKKPINVSHANTIIDYYHKIGVPIIYPTKKSSLYLKRLVLKYDIVGVHIFDAQLVATMLEYDLKKLFTVNTKDFEKFEEIEVANPLQKK